MEKESGVKKSLDIILTGHKGLIGSFLKKRLEDEGRGADKGNDAMLVNWHVCRLATS